jgi:hypothetical protein
VLKNRPDFSSYLAHFTSDREPLGLKDANNPANGFARLIAGQRLGSILRSQVIRASTMPWTNRRAVCFTECPWSSLLDHANQYSPFGVGFEKPHVFAVEGGPVYYVRADHFEKQRWEPDLYTFVTPFWPEYRPRGINEPRHPGRTVDYSHEREWRVPHDFTFELNQVKFVILPSYEEMARFPADLRMRLAETGSC